MRLAACLWLDYFIDHSSYMFLTCCKSNDTDSAQNLAEGISQEYLRNGSSAGLILGSPRYRGVFPRPRETRANTIGIIQRSARLLLR